MPIPFPEPIRILSDLHLGHVACVLKDAREIRPLLAGAGTVVFNGDTAEVRARSFKERAHEELTTLAEMCEELGVQSIYLTGNHDPRLTESHYLELAEGRLLVTHGDFLFRHVSPWSKKLRHCRPKMEEILSTVDAERLKRDFDYRMEITRRCCDVMSMVNYPKPKDLWALINFGLREFWPPTRFLVILHVWLTTPRRMLQALANYYPQARGIVYGHVHCPNIKVNGNRFAVNTGGYLSVVRATVAELEGRQLTIRKVQREGKECMLGEVQRVLEV